MGRECGIYGTGFIKEFHGETRGKDQDVDGRLIFGWMRKKNRSVWIRIVWFRVGRSVGLL